jgi:hypothetical protein
MPRLTFAVLLLAVPIAGCSSSTTDAQNAQAKAAQDSAYAKAMRTMPVGQRNATLYRAIADAKQTCQQVIGSEETAPLNGNPAWVATCGDTGQGWIVAVGPDGTAKVTGPVAVKAR